MKINGFENFTEAILGRAALLFSHGDYFSAGVATERVEVEGHATVPGHVTVPVLVHPRYTCRSRCVVR